MAARRFLLKGEIAIGAAGVLAGGALMLAGGRMCRGTCWIDDAFKMLLPTGYESWAGGLPAVLVGAAVIAHALLRKRK